MHFNLSRHDLNAKHFIDIKEKYWLKRTEVKLFDLHPHLGNGPDIFGIKLEQSTWPKTWTGTQDSQYNRTSGTAVKWLIERDITMKCDI